MGRHKFEDQFREKLTQREITPSSNSWEKLSGQLDSAEKKKGFSLWWIGIAATLLGAVFIAGLVYNNTQPGETPVVVTPAKEIDETRSITDPLESTKNLSEGIATEYESKKGKPSVKNNKATNVKPKRNTVLAEKSPATINAEGKMNTQIAYTASPDVNEVAGTEEEEKTLQNDPAIASEINNILAEIALLEKNNESVEEDEINALLARAASQISKNRQEMYASEKIDAEALLWDVEMDMEESFREKIFEVMKEGFQKARTAVANRNN